MAKDEFFSFGDEDVDTAADPWDPGSEGAAATLVLDEPGHQGAEPPPLESGTERVDEEVQRSRGDSGWDSSEKREPSSLRVRLVVALAVAVAAVGALRIIVPSLNGDGTGPAPSVSASQSSSSPAREKPSERPNLAVPSDRGKTNRGQHGADDQRARRSRAEARRKRKRRRDRSSGRNARSSGSRESTSSKHGSNSSVHQSPAPPSLSAPVPEEAVTPSAPPPVEPSTTPPPPAGSPPGLQDGAHSSEFGL